MLGSGAPCARRSGDRFGDDAIIMVSEVRTTIRATGAALSIIAKRTEDCFAQGLTRTEGTRPSLIAGSPDFLSQFGHEGFRMAAQAGPSVLPA